MQNTNQNNLVTVINLRMNTESLNHYGAFFIHKAVIFVILIYIYHTNQNNIEGIMQQININELKPHPRNNEFFDDIKGEKWEEFLESIRQRGVIEPVVITPDKTIVSGHQRVRACKELGITSVMCDVHTYDNEDQILQDLLETNVRQRGNIGGSAKKMGRIAKELERLYGVRNGSANETGNNRIGEPNNSADKSTQKYIADIMGVSVDTLQNYKLLSDMIPELEDLVETGIVKPTTALAIIKQLSEEEQIQMISSMDTTKKITKREVQKYIDENKKLQIENEKLKHTTNDSELKRLQNENICLTRQNNILEAQKKASDDLASEYKANSDEYMEVKKKLVHMGLEPEGGYNTFNATVQLTELNDEIMELLQNRLAPIKYQEYIFAVKGNELLRKNLMNTLSLVNDWYLSMLSYLEEGTYREVMIMEE